MTSISTKVESCSEVPSSKHFLKAEATAVLDSIDGNIYCDNNLTRLYGKNKCYKLTLRKDWIESKNSNDFIGDSKVAFVSGGGAGHFPCFAGLVSKGLLTGAVSGEIFASPSTKAVLQAIKLVTGKAGCILLYWNYTGDKLNFELAMKMANTKYNLNVLQLIFGDDCSIVKSKNNRVGRRGVAGNHIISNNLIGSISIASSLCYLPGQNIKDIKIIKSNELELGLGIHGEHGSMIIKFDNIKNIIPKMFDIFLDFDSKSRNYMPWISNNNTSQNVVLLINNLGGLSPLEMGNIKKYIIEYIINKFNNKLIINRIYCGSYCTSFDMKGFSITLMKIENNEYINALDYKIENKEFMSPNKFNQNGYLKSLNEKEELEDNKEDLKENTNSNNIREELSINGSNLLKKMILNACNSIISNKTLLNNLDNIVGDGDIGYTLENGCKKILKFNKLNKFNYKSLSNTLLLISELLQDMGGTSGPLYSYLFITISNLILKLKLNEINIKNILNVCLKSIDLLSNYCGAKEGDRTMLDALYPTINKLINLYNNNNNININKLFLEASKIVSYSCNNTSLMIANVGRTSYLHESTQQQCVDPGAKAVEIWIKSFSNSQI